MHIKGGNKLHDHYPQHLHINPIHSTWISYTVLPSLSYLKGCLVTTTTRPRMFHQPTKQVHLEGNFVNK